MSLTYFGMIEDQTRGTTAARAAPRFLIGPFVYRILRFLGIGTV